MKICRRTVTRWIKDKDAIFASKFKRRSKRLGNKVNRCLCPLMEVLVNDWFHEMRSKNSCIDGNTLRSKTREVYNSIHPFGPLKEEGSLQCKIPNTPFRASEGWSSNFLKRKGLSYRRISTTGRELPLDTLDPINDFYLQVSQVLEADTIKILE